MTALVLRYRAANVKPEGAVDDETMGLGDNQRDAGPAASILSSADLLVELLDTDAHVGIRLELRVVS